MSKVRYILLTNPNKVIIIISIQKSDDQELVARQRPLRELSVGVRK